DAQDRLDGEPRRGSEDGAGIDHASVIILLQQPVYVSRSHTRPRSRRAHNQLYIGTQITCIGAGGMLMGATKDCGPGTALGLGLGWGLGATLGVRLGGAGVAGVIGMIGATGEA